MNKMKDVGDECINIKMNRMKDEGDECINIKMKDE